MKKLLFTSLICFAFVAANAQIVKSSGSGAGLAGFKDAQDNWVVEPQYCFTYWYKDWQLGKFRKSWQEEGDGLLDASGKIIFSTGRYKSYYYNKEDGLITVTDLNDRVGLARIDGTIFLPCQWKSIYISKEYIEVTDFNDLKGLLLKDGKTWKYPCKYKAISRFKDVDWLQDEKGQWGVWSKGGKEMVAPIYSSMAFAAEDIYLVNKGGIEEKYKVVGGKWGYFANGKEIIPCVYDEATKFDNDVAIVKKDGEVKLIKNPLKDGLQIQIAENAVVNNKKQHGSAVSRYPAPDSDVDRNIPAAQKKAEHTFAFIIANENYADAPVPYALNDGRMFGEYCIKTLGLPKKNVNMYEDATFGNIIAAVEKMKSVADAYEGDASVIFYYAGHGFPDERQQSAYLLPVDGDAKSITTTGYSLANLYKEIAQLKTKSTVVLLDACFSGAKREDQMLASSRGVAIKVRDEVPCGNMVVFSAAQGDETAHQMEENHHGLFTYFLLKELQQTGGDVDLGTLTDYVTKHVKRQSVVINNKKQSPTVIPSAGTMDNWRSWKLK